MITNICMQGFTSLEQTSCFTLSKMITINTMLVRHSMLCRGTASSSPHSDSKNSITDPETEGVVHKETLWYETESLKAEQAGF